MDRRIAIKSLLGVGVLSVMRCSVEKNPSNLVSEVNRSLQDMQTFAYYQAFSANETLKSLNMNGEGTVYKMPLLKADRVRSGEEWLAVDFWHGHSTLHKFDVKSSDYDLLLKGETVYLFTNVVDGHKHCVKIVPKFSR